MAGSRRSSTRSVSSIKSVSSPKPVIIKDKQECGLCKRSAGNDLDFGGLFETRNIKAHHFCLLLSESINQSGKDSEGIWGFVYNDIKKEISNSIKRQCHYCEEFGATLGCSRKNCKRKFHLPCGLMNRTQHDMDKFISYCHSHRKPINLPNFIKKKIYDYKCLICLEKYHRKVTLENLVWADCCKKDVVLHISCIKKLATSAGYFTKCPACNNNKEFISTIKKYGVFVPERDASWELVENPYSELLHRHRRCDVEKCCCPKGREFKNSSGNWSLMLCELCGSFGAHKGCTDNKEMFVCSTCSEVAKNAKKSENSRIPTPVSLSNSPETVEGTNSDSSDSEIDIIDISSDSDDHFSEREPDTPSPKNIMPKYSITASNARKRKLPDLPAIVPQVAKKKTVFLQNRNRRYEQQVARKSTGGNQIYYNLGPCKKEQNLEKHNVPITKSEYKFSTPLSKYESSEKTDCTPYNNMESEDSKTITSIKNIMNSTHEKANYFQIFCAGPLILQCPSDADSVEIDNASEIEIATSTFKSEKASPAIQNAKITETIVIDDSDDDDSNDAQGVSGIRIENVCTLAEYEEDFSTQSRLNEKNC